MFLSIKLVYIIQAGKCMKHTKNPTRELGVYKVGCHHKSIILPSIILKTNIHHF